MINTSPEQTAHISNKLQKCRFCHFCLKPLLSNCCHAGFRSHWAAVHFSQGNTNAFFFLHNVARGDAFKCVCKGASHPSESHSETWCVPNLCEMWKKKKRICKKSIWAKGKKSFREYETETFNESLMILFKSKGLAFKGSWAALIPKSTEMDKWCTCIKIQCDILVTLSIFFSA